MTSAHTHVHGADVFFLDGIFAIFGKMQAELVTIDIALNYRGLQKNAPLTEMTFALRHLVINGNLAGQLFSVFSGK